MHQTGLDLYYDGHDDYAFFVLLFNGIVLNFVAALNYKNKHNNNYNHTK